jgi:putative restriction endonuclease
MTKIHHAAFDANLIGIDPDIRIHSPIGCSKSTMARFSKSASKGIAGTRIELPRRAEDHPYLDRLALRFEGLRKAS